jgi:endonuclease IV
MRSLCLSTGNFSRAHGKKAISIINSLDVDGIELMCHHFSLCGRPSEKGWGIIKGYDRISFHAPRNFSLLDSSNDEFNDILLEIKADYKKVGASAVVTHPTNKLPKILSSKMNFLTENLNPMGNPKLRPRLGFEKVLNERDDFGLCLDVAHAYDWGVEETDRIVKKWKHRIKQIHFSNNRYHKDHLPFEKVSRGFLKSIEPLNELNVPIVVEEGMPYKKISEIKKEIKRVKDILSL